MKTPHPKTFGGGCFDDSFSFSFLPRDWRVRERRPTEERERWLAVVGGDGRGKELTREGVGRRSE